MIYTNYTIYTNLVVVSKGYRLRSRQNSRKRFPLSLVYLERSGLR